MATKPTKKGVVSFLEEVIWLAALDHRSFGCNMVDLMWKRTCSLCRQVNSKAMKGQQFLFVNVIFHFCHILQIDSPKSYTAFFRIYLYLLIYQNTMRTVDRNVNMWKELLINRLTRDQPLQCHLSCWAETLLFWFILMALMVSFLKQHHVTLTTTHGFKKWNKMIHVNMLTKQQF